MFEMQRQVLQSAVVIAVGPSLVPSLCSTSSAIPTRFVPPLDAILSRHHDTGLPSPPAGLIKYTGFTRRISHLLGPQLPHKSLGSKWSVSFGSNPPS